MSRTYTIENDTAIYKILSVLMCILKGYILSVILLFFCGNFPYAEQYPFQKASDACLFLEFYTSYWPPRFDDYFIIIWKFRQSFSFDKIGKDLTNRTLSGLFYKLFTAFRASYGYFSLAFWYSYRLPTPGTGKIFMVLIFYFLQKH